MGLKAKFVVLFYVSGLVHHVYTYYYSQTQVDFSKTNNTKIMDIKKFTNRYVTAWNMGLQALYFLMAIIFEIVLLNKHRVKPELVEIFSKMRGFFFTTFLLPSTMFVAFFFWLIYHIKPDYMMPNGVLEIVPPWINHSIHTNIIFLPIVELSLQKMWIPSTKTAFIGLTIYSHTYNLIFFFTYFESGKWLYPLYEFLNWPQRIALMELMYVIGVLTLFLGIFIQKMNQRNCDITKANAQNKVAKVTKKLL